MNEKTGLQMDEISLSECSAQGECEYADAAVDLEWGSLVCIARIGWGVYRSRVAAEQPNRRVLSPPPRT